MSKKCKHPHGWQMPLTSKRGSWAVTDDPPQAIQCFRCGAWLSLGPSNDKPEAVQIEMRAAEIAANGRIPICDDDIADQVDCERCGWESYLDTWADQQPHAAWHAGYLASVIATHGGDGE